MTGRITIVLFTTLDGVAQAPGGPEETLKADSRTAAGRRPSSTRSSAR